MKPPKMQDVELRLEQTAGRALRLRLVHDFQLAVDFGRGARKVSDALMNKLGTTLLEKFGTLLERTIALVLLALALVYWARLVGVWNGSEYRFDTMPQYWRLAASVLAVSLPIAALGLWSGASWGVVVWFPIAAAELLMHTWLSPMFGTDPYRVVFYSASVLIYILYSLLMRFLANRK